MNQHPDPEDVQQALAVGRPVREHGPYRIQLGDEKLTYRTAVIADPVPTGQQVLEAAGVHRVRE